MTDTELHNLLAAALTPPHPTAALSSRVMAAIAREAPHNVDQQREQLRAGHAQSVTRLRWRFCRECAQALLVFACLFLPMRAGIHALVAPSPILVGFLLPALAAAVTASLWAPAGRLHRSA